MKCRKRFRPWLGLLLAVAACQPRPAPEPEPAPEPWPRFDFQAAAQRGEVVYRLDPVSSRVDIVVRRAGALARLGHDHAIVAADLEGWAYWPGEAGRPVTELRFPVASLEVDPPAARDRLGLGNPPQADAVEGTRRNMLNRVLAAERWPYITIEASHPRFGEDGWSAEVSFTVRGGTATRRIPLAIQRTAECLEASGDFTVDHAELGLEPYSALGGGLRVAEAIEIHFTLSAPRWARRGAPRDRCSPRWGE